MNTMQKKVLDLATTGRTFGLKAHQDHCVPFVGQAVGRVYLLCFSFSLLSAAMINRRKHGFPASSNSQGVSRTPPNLEGANSQRPGPGRTSGQPRARAAVLARSAGTSWLVSTGEAGVQKSLDRLAVDLGKAFPDMRGFSSRNLKYMRTFAKAWPEESIVQQLAAQIPWFHNCVLLEKLREPLEREWYIRQTSIGSRDDLCIQ